MSDIDTEGTVHSAPPVKSILVVPHDTNEITMDGLKGSTQYPRGFLADVAGTVKFQMLDDSFDTWVVNAGSQYAMVYKVIHTDSTATGIHALS